MSEQPEVITLDAIAGALDESYAQISAAIAGLSDPLSETPDEGGWTIRQLLSHLIGSLNRVPVHTGFFLSGGAAIPLQVGDDYWIAEWETASLQSFALALDAAYKAAQSTLAAVTPEDLQRTCGTPFGELPLDRFLLISVNGHVAGFHGPQLASFTGTA